MFGFGIYSNLSIFILSKNNLDGVKKLIPYLIRPKVHSLAIFNGKLEELHHLVGLVLRTHNCEIEMEKKDKRPSTQHDSNPKPLDYQA